MEGSLSKLSDRERLVLELAATGMADKEIGRELSISLNTLRTYWSRIRAKAGEATRAALVAAYVSRESGQARRLSDYPARGWILDTTTDMVMASDEHNRSYGLEPRVPHHASLYSGGVHPDDLDEALAQFQRVVTGEVSISHVVFRTVFPRAVEQVHMTLIGIKNEDGQVEKVFGTRVDAHDCRPHPPAGIRSGRWVRHLPTMNFEIDEDLARILGKPGTKVVTGEQLASMISAEEFEHILHELSIALERGEDQIVSDLRLFGPDGSEKWARLWRDIVRNPDGSIEIHGTLAVFD